MPIFAVIIALLVSVLVTWWLLRPGHGVAPLDHPTERSLHTSPVPRSGGLAILAGIVVAAVLLRNSSTALGCALALAVVSYVDDHYSLSARLRLMAHAIAAIVFVSLEPPVANIAVALIAVIALMWLTNLYNFMDGADGLAGGMALFGFGAYAIAAVLAGDTALAVTSAVIAAAAAGFLVSNFPPAKIFMGDVGSIPLGFLAGALGIDGWREGAWPLWFPLVVFAPFVVDASVTLARRLLRRERVWEAHRSHYYQRLILSGWSHRRTALAEYALMIFCAAVAIGGQRAPLAAQAALIVAIAIVIVICMALVDRRWRRHQGATSA